jgi:hypothetical protein
MSLSDYRRHQERELKRDPGRIERDQEQVRQWSMRVVNKGRDKEKETHA